MIPEGTRIYQAPESRYRRELAQQVVALFNTYGYQQIELPSLEHYDPNHDLADKSFKIVDRSGLLVLRSDFTTAVANMVQGAALEGEQKLQYGGQVWLQEADTELGRVREYTQFGVEHIGTSSPSADSQMLELANQTLEAVGLKHATLEVGLPSLVRDLLAATGLNASQTAQLQHSIHRKSTPELASLLKRFEVEPQLARTLLALPDLYGGQEVLSAVEQYHLTDKAKADLEWLKAVVAQCSVPLIFDLGRARRMHYYTGINFQAYAKDFGLPVLGGGRYDGTLLPQACGFTVGLERMMEALSGGQA